MLVRYRDGEVSAGELDPLLVADFEGLPELVSGAPRPRRADRSALDEIWQRVRRLNRYVEEQAPWQLAKDDARAQELDRVLRTLAEGLRAVTVLLWPYLPASAERLLAALGAPDAVAARAPSSAPGTCERVQRDRVAVPQGRRAGGEPARDDRLPHPSRPVRAAERGARGGRRARGRHAHAHRRHRRRLLPRGARRGRGLPTGVCGGRPPPQRGPRLRRRRPRRAARAGGPRALPGDRRDRP